LVAEIGTTTMQALDASFAGDRSGTCDGEQRDLPAEVRVSYAGQKGKMIYLPE